jgi:hypothetical protein
MVITLELSNLQEILNLENTHVIYNQKPANVKMSRIFISKLDALQKSHDG